MLIESTKLLTVLKQMVDTRTQQVAAGAVKNFEDYKMVTGQISGLNSAISEINSLQEKQRKADGDE